MTGIFLYVAMGVWFFVASLVATLIALALPKRPWRIPLALILLVALIPLPLIDEIVGKKQFELLCKENSTIQVDPKATGKTVFLADLPDVEIEGTWVRVVLKPWRYVDATTRETMVSYNTLEAVGGRFIRALGISEGAAPLTFEGTCVPKNRPASAKAFEEMGIHYIQRPKNQ